MPVHGSIQGRKGGTESDVEKPRASPGIVAIGYHNRASTRDMFHKKDAKFCSGKNQQYPENNPGQFAGKSKRGKIRKGWRGRDSCRERGKSSCLRTRCRGRGGCGGRSHDGPQREALAHWPRHVLQSWTDYRAYLGWQVGRVCRGVRDAACPCSIRGSVQQTIRGQPGRGETRLGSDCRVRCGERRVHC